MSSNDSPPNYALPKPALAAIFVLCLLVDLGLVLNSAQFFREQYAPFGAGILLGQFGLMGAIRLRYDAQRWFAYVGMAAITAMGIFILLQDGGRPVSLQHFLASFLMAAVFLAVACIVPGAIAQERYRIESEGRQQFQLKHLLLVFFLLGVLFVVLPKLGTIIEIMFTVFLIGLPIIVANLALAITRSERSYSWCMLIMLSGLMIVAILVGSPNSTGILGWGLGQAGTMWLGGFYLLSFPQQKVERSQAETTIAKTSEKDLP